MKDNIINIGNPAFSRAEQIQVFKILIIVIFLVSILFSGIAIAKIADAPNSSYSPSYSLLQGNSLIAPSDPSLPVRKVEMIITAYSSTAWQTDSTPFITATGTEVRDGVVANNMLPLGTEIRIPELYGNKVFVVEDRMNSRKSYYHLDIWFPEYSQAKEFGAKRTYVEILEG